MSEAEFSDECAGCRPAMLDMKTGEQLGPEAPPMQVVNKVWSETTKQEREAFHRFTCHNSREGVVMRLVNPLMEKIQQGLLQLSEDQDG